MQSIRKITSKDSGDASNPNFCVKVVNGMARKGHVYENGGVLCKQSTKIPKVPLVESINKSTSNFETVVLLDDEFLEGDGVFNDDMVQDDSYGLTENLSDGFLEEKYKLAIKDKQWYVIEEIFRECTCQIKREQLYFLCADSLTSPTEFLGIVKQFEGKMGKDFNKSALAMIGGKLLINADLCENFKAGVIILRIMVEAGIWFHHLYIKTFHAANLSKSAVQSCLKEKAYDLLANLIEGSGFLGLLKKLNPSAKKLNSPIRLINLVNVLQQITSHISICQGDGTDAQQILKLASLSLQILRTIFKCKRHVIQDLHDNIAKVLKDIPNGTWQLCKIFLSLETIGELESLLTLSYQNRGLISWKDYNYKRIFNFFLTNFDNVPKIYNLAVRFVNILKQEGVLPEFDRFSRLTDKNTLKIYDNMDENDVKLFLKLFCESVNRNSADEHAVHWNIVIETNHFLGRGLGMNAILERVLCKYFPNLLWTKSFKTYSIEHLVLPSRNSPIPPLKNLTFPDSFIHKVEEQKKKSHVIKRWLPNTITDSSNPPNLRTSSCEPPAKRFSQASCDIPEVIRNHPRFSSPLKDDTPVMMERKALFSKSRNALQSTITDSCPKEVPERDRHVYQRLFEDIDARLTFYVNENRISKDEANGLLNTLPRRLFCNLPRTASGEAIYDDSAFERIHFLINDEVEKKFLRQWRNQSV